MEPISAGIAAAASLIDSMMKQSAARRAANQELSSAQRREGFGLTAAQQGLEEALGAARGGQADRLNAAGGLRFDQNGNATYYDRDQGRWVTILTPQQQRVQQAEQAQQERTLARGSQASEDYAQQRAHYLYKQPPTEGLIRDEITRLIQQSQGQGERALNTIMSRFGTRTAGNIPTVQQMDTGPSPAQQLADTMLKARTTALTESQSRQKAHDEQYLPAMQAFERTANIVPQESQTGKTIAGMAAGGMNDRLAALADYAKQLPGIYEQGTKNRLGVIGPGGSAQASADASKASMAGAGLGLSGFAQLLNAMKSSKDKDTKTTGMVGPTAGGTYNSADDKPADPFAIGGWDHRRTFAPESARSGTGGEAAPFGGTPQSGAIEGWNPDPWGYNVPSSYGNPYGGSSSSISVPDYYQTPWSF